MCIEERSVHARWVELSEGKTAQEQKKELNTDIEFEPFFLIHRKVFLRLNWKNFKRYLNHFHNASQP